MSNGWIGNYAYFRARIHSASVAIVDMDENKSYTYGDLENRANRLASVLKEEMGIIKGDRVAFLSRNRVELLDAYFATGKLGAILVPYNARLSAKELQQLMAMETPKVLFYEDLFGGTVESIRPGSSLTHCVVLPNGKWEGQDESYGQILERGKEELISCEDLEMEDIHLIIHTGGTTGLPKGGLVSHRNEIFNSFNEICTWGLNHEDSTLLLLPLFHTGGWNLLTLPLLHVGGKIFINRQYDPKVTMEVVAREKLSYLFGAATIFRMMVELPEFENADFRSLKWIMAGAAPTPLNIMEMFWKKGVKFVLGYGMTEAGPNNLSAPAQFLSQETVKEKYTSVGKPMYLTLVKLVDEENREIKEANTPGELLWSGPQIFSGYWGNEKETEETLVEGWVHTGDMAVQDEEGFYSIVGRKKNMFISGGENVFPPEIESALYDLEEVREVCVFGVADEKWGEVGKAVVSLKSGKTITKEQIQESLGKKLARYKIPKYIAFVEDVPKNNVGKIVVKQVVELYGKPIDEIP